MAAKFLKHNAIILSLIGALALASCSSHTTKVLKKSPKITSTTRKDLVSRTTPTKLTVTNSSGENTSNTSAPEAPSQGSPLDNPFNLISQSRAALGNLTGVSFSLNFSSTSGSQALSGTIEGTIEGNDSQLFLTLSQSSLEVLYIAGSLFVKGNPGGLSSYLGLNSQDSYNYQNSWIEIPQSDQLYSSLDAWTTLSFVENIIFPNAPYSSSKITTFNDTKVLGISGVPNPNSSLTTFLKGVIQNSQLVIYLEPTGPYLPVGFQASASSSGTYENATFKFTSYSPSLALRQPANITLCPSIPSCP